MDESTKSIKNTNTDEFTPRVSLHYHEARSMRRRRLEMLRRSIIYAGIAGLVAWLLLGYFTDWTGVVARCSSSSGHRTGLWDIKCTKKCSEQFEWDDVTPTRHLIYHSCYDGLECARLDVPMDWNRTDGKGARVAIAIVKIPAKVPVTDSRYGGPVLINPGGPGGSGTYLAIRSGRDIQTVVDAAESPSQITTSSSLYYDIIGFDPRGVNLTTPHFSCFPDAFSRQVWQTQLEAEGIIGESKDLSNVLWTRAKALGEGCSRSMINGEDGNIKNFMNTSPVVRDMVEIIERHGEWRETEARHYLANSGTRLSLKDQSMASSREAILERTRWRKGEEKLLYWGFSYGTVIGATFAAMYPDLVGRVVIDGVVDTPDYYQGGWLHNLQDSDLIVDKFCEYCSKAGPDHCPFYTEGGAEGVKTRFERVLSSLKKQPIGVPANAAEGAEIVTWTDARVLIMNSLYVPYEQFPVVAQILLETEQGNGTSLARIKRSRRSPACPNTECRRAEPYSQWCMRPGENNFEVKAGILCTDGESLLDDTREDFESYLSELRRQSKWVGDIWAHIRLECVGWDPRPKWRFTGPFGGKTAHPMLVIGNTLDPVTPLRNAFNVSSRYANSVVLQQDSEGHCSLSAPSLCTAKTVRNYFQTGELPSPKTVCDVDARPLLGTGKDEWRGESKVKSWEDTVLLNTLKRLMKSVFSG
ncbi:hypothetical protein L228DRAFT_248214 [Xylona heveae TC161]|uniref:Proteinase n=1 Tax=Xylona heveae (strain CBS 132557 / TC161) TaxID=1328760 RepID=A0A165FXG2_XYLHT|nr:hypothetical protein L228DRAFT_248214 [Xylona heveae TC161]KZF21501.1 hypothetical protein L228DRAFT_248214 [Xylona heveae TC161]